MKELNELVRQWLEARNIIQGSSPVHQFVKGIEEAGEFVEGLTQQDMDLLKDGAGDFYVCMNSVSNQLGYDMNTVVTNKALDFTESQMITSTCNLALLQGRAAGKIIRGKDASADLLALVVLVNSIVKYHGIHPEECYAAAYNEIKHRTGRMVNNVFIKEEDL